MKLDSSHEKVERTDTGVSITAQLKRGTGTRDQDTITGKFKAEDLDEYLDQREVFWSALEADATRARNIQPEGDE